jgi:hypothetical protein
LAHEVDAGVIGAYQRSDRLEKKAGPAYSVGSVLVFLSVSQSPSRLPCDKVSLKTPKNPAPSEKLPAF